MTEYLIDVNGVIIWDPTPADYEFAREEEIDLLPEE